MTFSYIISDVLKKRISKLGRKNKRLAQTFRKKVNEVVNRDVDSVRMYKNLRSPQNKFKRIHLTGSHILIFHVDVTSMHIIFVDIVHWDEAYE